MVVGGGGGVPGREEEVVRCSGEKGGLVVMLPRRHPRGGRNGR
jgi:hypothetical protein